MQMEISAIDYSSSRHRDAVLTLLNDYALSPEGGAEELSEYTRKNLLSELELRSGVKVFLAFNQEEAAGLLIAIEGFSTFACKPLLNVHDVYVSAGNRTQGVARALFEQMESYAQTIGCCKITLEVLENNRVAREAYQRFGFEAYQLVPEMGKALFWQKNICNNET